MRKPIKLSLLEELEEEEEIHVNSETHTDDELENEYNNVYSYEDDEDDNVDKNEDDNKSIIKRDKLLEEFFDEPLSDKYNYVEDFHNSGWVGMFNLDMILSYAINNKASDVHITGGQEVCFTILGDIVYVPFFGIPDEDVMNDIVTGMLTNEQMTDYIKDMDYDSAYVIKHGPYIGRRFRANIGRTFGYDFIVLRVINEEIPTMDALEIEQEIRDWAELPSGCWLFTGATGTGKALSPDTKVITLKGVKDIVDVNVGEYVYTQKGASVEVIGKHRNIVNENYRVVFSNGVYVDSCKDHLWDVELSCFKLITLSAKSVRYLYNEYRNGVKSSVVEILRECGITKWQIDEYSLNIKSSKLLVVELLLYSGNTLKTVINSLDMLVYFKLFGSDIKVRIKTLENVVNNADKGITDMSIVSECRLGKTIYRDGYYEYSDYHEVVDVVLSSIEPIEYICLEVDGPNKNYLITEHYIPTHNSTSLASIIRNMQLTQSKKIITIEKPIEYTYPQDGKSLIVQRNVGIDVLGFYEGLTAAMRQNPDVILIGEVRNTEEVGEFIRAAETGHLSISTLHSNSVTTTINRIMSLFSGDEQARVMSTLSDTLRGVCSQVLVKDKVGGRFACREILTVNEEIRGYIANRDIKAIRQYLVDNKLTMEHKLIANVISGRCTLEEAKKHAVYPDFFEELMWENRLK